MSGDWESWDNTPSKHAAPSDVADQFRKNDLRDGLVRLILWSLVIVGLCAAAVWVILKY